MDTLRLIAIMTLLASWGASFAASEDAEYRLPTKLPHENREAYRAQLDQLESNTAMLHIAFESGDRARERELYADRERILVACQDLMPAGELLIREGIVQSKHGARISLRLSKGNGVSFNVGTLSSSELREQYEAVQIGDDMRFTYTEKAHLYDNEVYSYQLTGLKRIRPGVQNMEILRQNKNEKFQDTTVMVLHPDSKDDTIVILATIKNNQMNAIDFENDKQHYLKITAGSDVEIPYRIRHRTPIIDPEKIGIILFDISKQDLTGHHLTVRAGTRTGSLLFAQIKVKR